MSIDHQQLVGVLVRGKAKWMAYIHSIVRDTHLAEDVYQEVSMTAVRRLEVFETEAHLINFIWQVARNLAINELKRCQHSPRLLSDQILDLLEAHWARVEVTDVSGREQALRVCMSKLTPYSSQLLHLRYVENHVGEELARTAGKSQSAVDKAMVRIRRALANCVRERMSALRPRGA